MSKLQVETETQAHGRGDRSGHGQEPLEEPAGPPRTSRWSPHATRLPIASIASAPVPDLSAGLFFDDYQQMIDKTRPQAVVIALPNFLHHPVTMYALKAGCHVLCEKPMAMNVCDAQEMAGAAARLDRTLMINFSYRFKATTLAMEQTIASGQLGQIYFANTGWLRQNGIRAASAGSTASRCPAAAR